MECRSRSWIAAITAGILVFLAVALFGDAGFMAGLLLGLMTTGLLGGLLVWALCTGAGSVAENTAFMEADWTPEPFEPARRVVAMGGATVSARPMPDSTPVAGAPPRETVTLTPEQGSHVSPTITDGPPVTPPAPEPAPAPPPPMALAGLHAAMGVPPLAVMNDPLSAETVTHADDRPDSREVAGVGEMPDVEDVPQAEPASGTAAMAMESTGSASARADAEAGADPDADGGGIVPLARNKADADTDTDADGDTDAAASERVGTLVHPEAEGGDVTRITGVGPMLSTWLAEQGVTRIDQIAAWDEADIARYAGMMGRMGHRIRSEDWVGQARALGSVGDGGAGA